MPNKNDYLYELNFINGLTQQEPNQTDYDFLTEHSYYSSNWMYVPTDTLISLGGVTKGSNNYNNNNFVENPYGSQTYVFDGVLRVDIDSINKTISYTGANVAPMPISNAQHPDWGFYSAFLINTVDANGNFSCQNFMGQDSTPALSYTSFSDFDDAILHLQRFFKHINIWVDGELWSSAEVTYNWQSVPSISGKNGILQSLSTLVNINDGNPVSGASASAVNIIPASVVSGMIQTGASDVIVSFEIPQLTSGTYDSIKLVGKRGGIPRSKTDGEFIETLSDSDTSKTLTGLTKGYTYWFVIFAEDSKGSSSESDPYPYETGEGESIAFFEIDLGQGGKDIVRYDATKTIGGHKQGELFGDYTIANGILTATEDIYWNYDSNDNPKSIPANCTLYFEYDTRFPGEGTGYLDWYVTDSTNNNVIYWCFDTKYSFQEDRWYNCKTVCKVEDGKIKRWKYMVDDIEVYVDVGNIQMPCCDSEGSKAIKQIHFNITNTTDFKNMSIYYDFSTYHDNGGGYSGYN